jgi:hypothetical protein
MYSSSHTNKPTDKRGKQKEYCLAMGGTGMMAVPGLVTNVSGQSGLNGV